MSAIGLLILLGAVALVCAAYYFSIRRAFELPLDGIELHPITTADGWRILLYRHREGDSNGDPVLLCHGFSSNHWNLNAPRGESLADYLAAHGHDCWTIDLRGTRSSTPPFGSPRHRATFDGYVMEDLPTAIDYIRKLTGHDRVHWVGHSLGGTLLYAFEAAHGPGRIASGTTIASPPELRPTWPAWQSHLIRAMERAPGAFALIQRSLAPLHALIKPKTRLVPIDWDNLNTKFSIAEFFSAVETPPGPVTRTMEEWARHKYLAVDNDRINVLTSYARLETPVLLLGCPLDPIVPASTVRDYFGRLPQSDKRYLELSRREGCERDYDHIDPPFAKNAATEVFAPIERWIAEHAITAGKRAQPTPAALKESPRAEPETPLPSLEPASTPSSDPETAPIAAKEDLAPPRAVAPESSALWDRALRDAANILGDLDESPAETPVALPAKPKRASTKKKVATKRRAAKTASAKPKTASKKKTAAKPKRTTASRISTKKKAASAAKTKSESKAKAKQETKTKSKSNAPPADKKKTKEKQTKSKDKFRKKKSKDKKSGKK